MKLMQNKKSPNTIIEFAQSHDCSLGFANVYIDAIAESGEKILKFQTHFANKENTYDAPWHLKFCNLVNHRYDYKKKLVFMERLWIELNKYVIKKKSKDFLLKKSDITK